MRRQAVVLFSDGEDTSSLVSFEEVLEIAKRSETAIYTIALRDAGAQTRGFREAEFVLRSLAQETGGRAFFLQRSRTSQASTHKSGRSSPANTRSATRQRTRSATVRGAA